LIHSPIWFLRLLFWHYASKDLSSLHLLAASWVNETTWKESI
jgi:hypothetical protein